jgi:uncharacterized RDD family membrane protein YckC
MTEQPDLQLRRYAEWHERFLAYVIDVAPLILLFGVLTALTEDSDSYLPIGFWFSRSDANGESGGSLMISGIPSVVFLVLQVSWFAYNWLLRQGRSGQTFGKKLMHIAVLDRTNGPLGASLTFVRQLAHVLDFLPCFLGYLWPAWDRQGRTFADMIMRSHVYRVGHGRL